jgi:hypothetical protein
MEPGFQESQAVISHPATELGREGRYLAEVPVTLIETGSAWSPYFSLEDAEKLEEVRLALRRGDLRAAAQLGKVYELTPVGAE